MLDTDIEGFPETSQRKRGRFGRERYNRKNKLHEQERDIVKLWKERDMEFAIYGMENQTLPEKYMPLRILGYDGASYRSQLQKKRKRPVAVLTIVLYFGTDKVWDKPTHLKDVIYIPEGLGEYVNDYKITVFNIAWLTEEEIARFKSDFKIVANFFSRWTGTAI